MEIEQLRKQNYRLNNQNVIKLCLSDTIKSEHRETGHIPNGDLHDYNKYYL